MRFPLCSLLCPLCLLMQISVFVDLASYLAVGGLASVELSCSLSLSLSPQARLLEICNIVPVCDCAAVCSRSGFIMFWTLLRVIVWAICTYLGTCVVTPQQFSVQPDLFLKLFDITSTRSFQGARISSGTFLLWNSRGKFCCFSL